MRILILLSIGIYMTLSMSAQDHIDSLDCYQGVFEFRDVILDPDGSDNLIPDTVKIIRIIKNKKMIEIHRNIATGVYRMDGKIISIGFYNGPNRLSNVNELSWKAMKKSAFVEVYEKVDNAIYYNGFMCDDLGFSLSLFNRNIDNIRVNSFEYELIQVLFDYEGISGQNYIEDFLSMEVKSVCVDQLDVYDSKEGSNIGYLVRDDLVEVLEADGDWLKVKYLKTNVVYWTYSSCLE